MLCSKHIILKYNYKFSLSGLFETYFVRRILNKAKNYMFYLFLIFFLLLLINDSIVDDNRTLFTLLTRNHKFKVAQKIFLTATLLNYWLSVGVRLPFIIVP